MAGAPMAWAKMTIYGWLRCSLIAFRWRVLQEVKRVSTACPQGGPVVCRQIWTKLVFSWSLLRKSKKSDDSYTLELPRCRKLNENLRLLRPMSKNSMKNQDYQQNEGLNPASAHKFPEAYCESRKKVLTVTHLKRESWLGFMKFQWFYVLHLPQWNTGHQAPILISVLGIPFGTSWKSISGPRSRSRSRSRSRYK